MTPVAVLFCDPRGVYASPALTRGGGAIPWGLPALDARSYAGPHPVVAHPPCERWGAYAAGAALAAAECLRAWVAWCSVALAVRLGAAHTSTLRNASPDAVAVLTAARDATAALMCSHASADVTGDAAADARAKGWTRAVGALVALATGEGPYALAMELPEATEHPRVAEALAAPVLAACGALEALALTLDAAEAARP